MAYEPFLDQDPDAPFMGAQQQPRVFKQTLAPRPAQQQPDSLRAMAMDLARQSQEAAKPNEQDIAAMRDYAQRRDEQAKRDFLLGTAMSMGGSAFQPVGAQVLKQALASQTPEKLGGGVVQGGQFFTDPEATAQRRAKTLEDQAKIYATLAQGESSEALRAAMIQQREPMVPVYDAATQTTTYVPRSQAAGMTAPPRSNQNKNLPSHAVEEINKHETRIAQFNNLVSNWKDEYGGYGTSVGNVLGRYNPYASQSQQDQSQWWQGYQEFVNDVRHGQFGSALTPTEKAEFDKAIIAPDMAPQQIKNYLLRQQVIAQRAYQRHVGNYQRAGYNMQGYGDESPSAVDAPIPLRPGASGSWGGGAPAPAPATSGQQGFRIVR